ncbi:hypothetical protein BT69DRAFT_1296169 [Atractiella rhizophila]|nr:hypothetical protein BT69DRAFT_1296169 [Atractiella rhizophila]
MTMSLAANAQAEVTTFLDQWLLKWGKAVIFNDSESDEDLQEHSYASFKLDPAGDNHHYNESSLVESEALVRELEQWHYKRTLPADSSAARPPKVKLPQTLFPRSGLESLPTEILQMIFNKAVPQWDDNTFELLYLSCRLYPATTSWKREMSLGPKSIIRHSTSTQELARCPFPAAKVPKLPRDRLICSTPSLCYTFRTAGSAAAYFDSQVVFEVHFSAYLVGFSDLAAVFDSFQFFDGYGLLKRNITLTELQVLDDVEPQLVNLIQYMDGWKTINILSSHRPRQEKLWFSQNTEHYELARNNPVFWHYSFETHEVPVDLVLPNSIQDLRMLYGDYEEEELTTRDSFVINVLTNTIHRNEPLPHFRLLELFIPEESLDTFLYPILRACKGTLEILRLSVREYPGWAPQEHVAWPARSEGHPLYLTKDFYDLVAQIPRLQVLELRHFPLADSEFPCTGPFTPSLQELALTHCFGKGAGCHILTMTSAFFKDTLRVLYLVGPQFERSPKIYEALRDPEKERKNLKDGGTSSDYLNLRLLFY